MWTAPANQILSGRNGLAVGNRERPAYRGGAEAGLVLPHFDSVQQVSLDDGERLGIRAPAFLLCQNCVRTPSIRGI